MVAVAPTAGGGGLTMTEYIERKALRDTLYDADAITMSGVKILNQFPAADVAPVRHGRWVDKPLIKSFKHTNIPVVECSACGIDFCDIINNHYFMYKYCPNCGAKMDGRGEK